MAKKESEKKQGYIITPTFRVSFPDIVEKNVLSNKYRIVMLFDKDADLSGVTRIAKEAKKAKFGDKQPKNFCSPFTKVDDLPEDQWYSGYEEGMIITKATSTYRPAVIDQKKRPIELEEMDSKLYGGCYARAAINAFGWAKMGNSGVSFGLNAIQIVKDGEPFGSRIDATEAFSDIEEDDFNLDDEDNEDNDDMML